MKGVAIAWVLIVALAAFCGFAAATPPIIPPVQYEQFCEAQKVAGTGVIDMSTSIIDKKIALEYYNTMAGDGSIELDSEQAFSQNADKLQREIAAYKGTDKKEDRCHDGVRCDGKCCKEGQICVEGQCVDPCPEGGVPCDGKCCEEGQFCEEGQCVDECPEARVCGETCCDEGYICDDPEKEKCKKLKPQESASRGEDNGDGKGWDHKDTEKASLNLFESSKMTYSGATPLVGGKYLHSKAFYGGIGADVQEMFAVNEMEKEQQAFFVSTTPYGKLPRHEDKFIKKLKHAGRDTDKVDHLMGNNPAHLIGIDTKNSFNGTWGTDANWHKIFYKDIKAHEMFTGKFEAEKLIKFHEYPVPEKENKPCEGIDC